MSTFIRPTYTIALNDQGKVKLSVSFVRSPVRRFNLVLDSEEQAIEIIRQYFSDAVLIPSIGDFKSRDR